MLLCDNIEYDIKTIYQGLDFNISFQLKVHNYDETHALISLFRNHVKMSGHSHCDCIILHFEELKIPHNLTAKNWIKKLVIKHDLLFNKEQTDEKMLKLKHTLSLEFKIKDF